MSKQKEEGLEVLIDRYWDLAYAEGKEGRTTDTPNDDAMDTRYAIDTALEAQAAENAELRASRDGYAKQDAARAAECDRLRAEYLNASKDAQDFMARALAAETALATAREDALEDAAKLAKSYAKELASACLRGRLKNAIPIVARGRAIMAIRISRAIRALKTKEPSHG